jgi:hypothetical protein
LASVLFVCGTSWGQEGDAWLEGLKDKAKRPSKVQLLSDQQFDIVIGGRKAGTTKAPKGAKVDLVDVQGAMLTVALGAAQGQVHYAATDVQQQMLAKPSPTKSAEAPKPTSSASAPKQDEAKTGTPLAAWLKYLEPQTPLAEGWVLQDSQHGISEDGGPSFTNRLITLPGKLLVSKETADFLGFPTVNRQIFDAPAREIKIVFKKGPQREWVPSKDGRGMTVQEPTSVDIMDFFKQAGPLKKEIEKKLEQQIGSSFSREKKHFYAPDSDVTSATANGLRYTLVLRAEDLFLRIHPDNVTVSMFPEKPKVEGSTTTIGSYMPISRSSFATLPLYAASVFHPGIDPFLGLDSRAGGEECAPWLRIKQEMEYFESEEDNDGGGRGAPKLTPAVKTKLIKKICDSVRDGIPVHCLVGTKRQWDGMAVIGFDEEQKEFVALTSLGSRIGQVRRPFEEVANQLRWIYFYTKGD